MELLIDEKEAAKTVCKAVQSLRNDRHNGRGLPYIKLGRSVRYSAIDIQKYIEARKIQTEDSQNDAAQN